ncbi:MAG: phosphate propanoyltransferase [Butyricicoccus sp.]|nr:phosphate propanoyltransferase [Butyricicoccus sp.]
MDKVIQSVLDAIPRAGLVEVEVSARHVHLTDEHIEVLFGKGAKLTPKRPLSQPGQYLSEERVTLIGPKGKKERTAVLGPARPATQIELSKSDCVDLGVKAPVRMSGDVKDSGPITIVGPCGTLELTEGAIIAKEHVHLTPDVAQIMGVVDQQHVDVEVFTDRPVIFRDVIVRVSKASSCRMHIDFDEANAALVSGFTLGKIIK